MIARFVLLLGASKSNAPAASGDNENELTCGHELANGINCTCGAL